MEYAKTRALGPPAPEPPERVPRREPSGTTPSPNPSPSQQRRPQIRRQGRRIDARVAAIRRTRGIRLRAKPLEDATNVELRVVLANGSDETCDSPDPDEYLEITTGATVDGQPVRGYVPDLLGNNRAVLLGPVSSNGDELDIWLPSRPTPTGDIRVELIRRAPAGPRV